MEKTNNDGSVNGYITNVAPDLPDGRDWTYRAALINLKPYIDPPRNLHILDQKAEGACTGFGLGAVINFLKQQRGELENKVSTRMLYEMAKRYDEWDGEAYSGSSCRGAIKGWYNMGVCEHSLWKYAANKPGKLTIDAAKNARSTTVGAYYRLNHRISDFHAAINEAGVIYCSAKTHDRWSEDQLKDGVIEHSDEPLGGHAFAIVGYNNTGFWVQNSWGRGWGKDGLAIWTYEDWQQNIQDAWVLRMALETPNIWHLPHAREQSYAARLMEKQPPNRGEIAGHFVHIDDGKFHESGKYWSTLNDVMMTTALIENSTSYDHVLLYAHGGLNSPDDSASRIESMKEVFKENRIYPYHFMYDTGLMEELKDVIFGKSDQVNERAGSITDASDWLIEKLSRIPGRAFWREMKNGARSPFNKAASGAKVLDLFLKAMNTNNKIRKQDNNIPIQLHLVGHSTGAILMGWLLSRISKHNISPKPRIASISLMAPAASIEFYDDHYLPLLKSAVNRFGIDKLSIYNLSEQLEKDDKVGPYRKSLLYLVSRAFEEKKNTPILGMKEYEDRLTKHDRMEVIQSEGKNGSEERSRSDSHGGFDNDVRTMNSILKSVLGKEPIRSFTKEDLKY